MAVTRMTGHCLPRALFRTNARRTPALLSCESLAGSWMMLPVSQRPPTENFGDRCFANTSTSVTKQNGRCALLLCLAKSLLILRA
jgi:hypothetical protein